MMTNEDIINWVMGFFRAGGVVGEGVVTRIFAALERGAEGSEF